MKILKIVLGDHSQKCQATTCIRPEIEFRLTPVHFISFAGSFNQRSLFIAQYTIAWFINGLEHIARMSF